ncbi:DUF3231 family protein [Paenibacillus antri]|uniref:DUF3231 family protein n=1 Tax=Paenibacillus antri TaxID=2582848 RepID=A0A5R9G4G8_9BACL|nr:DUF3231 family protein [Paenibacillus antri]TLS51257.1 DUF3231 family protein [Paenibacillus antri]
MNLLEVIKDVFKPFLDGEKPPLHVGEVMNLWFFLAVSEQTIRGEQVAINTVQDEDLKKHLQELMDIHSEIRKDIIGFLQKEGVPLPETTPPKKQGDFESIPADAKLSDQEAAQLVSENLVVAMTMAARGITEAVRTDVGAMFAKFFMSKVTFGITYKAFLQKKGWLLVPPPFKIT